MKQFYLYLVAALLITSNGFSQILFSEYSEGSSYNKYLEIYNYSNETVLLSQFVLTSCTNGCLNGNNFFINEFPDGASIEPGEVYVVASTQADQLILNEADFTFQYCCGNGDDVYALMLSGLTGDFFDAENALDIIGDETTWQEGVGWDIAGVSEATKNHTIVRKSTVSEHNAGNWSLSAGTNIDDSEWIVLEIDDWSNIGFHNFDDILIDIYGCTDFLANNYNPSATIDDGSCDYGTVFYNGCYTCDLAANFFDFSYLITESNMSIAITEVENLLVGDTIGVFYIGIDNVIKCGGSSVFEGDNMAISAWANSSLGSNYNGFNSGDTFIFLLLRDGVVYDMSFEMNNNPPFTNVFGSNAFGQITEFTVAGEFMEECNLPLGISMDCEEFFNITELDYEPKSILTTDIFGRVIKNKTSLNSLFFEIRNDGTCEKKFLLSK
tara:strand:- start:8861 stop:10177 length:1317 start_codon:yes stop_codon:yes gene_type:complete